MTTPSITSIIALIPEMGWAQFTPAAAAEKLGVVPSKVPDRKEILKRFHTHITEEFQKTFNPEDLVGASIWEASMEVILCRLELLTPYKAALQCIYKDIKEDPCLLQESFSLDLLDSRWFVVNFSKREGVVVEKLMVILYGITLRHWLNDNSPVLDNSLDNTMAFLDQTIQAIRKAMGIVGG
jgi:hypothetical protein